MLPVPGLDVQQLYFFYATNPVGFLTLLDLCGTQREVSNVLVSGICAAGTPEPSFKESGRAAVSWWLRIIASSLA